MLSVLISTYFSYLKCILQAKKVLTYQLFSPSGIYCLDKPNLGENFRTATPPGISNSRFNEMYV